MPTIRRRVVYDVLDDEGSVSKSGFCSYEAAKQYIDDWKRELEVFLIMRTKL